MERDCALVIHCDEVDERRYDIFQAVQDGGGVVVTRRCWWYDEEVQQWLLDESTEWYFTREQAMQLGMAIQQAGVPSVRSVG